MKIKLSYPKIPNTLDCPLRQCVAFEKLDGTNIHFVWDHSDGWFAFGTRRDRFLWNEVGKKAFDLAHPELKGLAQLWDPELKLDQYLQEHYAKHGEVIVFAEYHGPNSFAGSHDIQDQKRLTLIDVLIGGASGADVPGVMMSPEQFMRDFQAFGIPKVVFQGKFSGQLFLDVRKGKYDVKEGVVVKGVVDKKVYMAKIKTQAYLDQLKEKFKDNWKDYWE